MPSERVDYTGEGLAEADLAPTPYAQLTSWVEEALARQRDRGDLGEPMMITVATVDRAGMPDLRPVLCRFLDPRGPGFVSASTSGKGIQLAANDAMAATFTWLPLFRTVRLRGHAEHIERDALATYWEERPWGSRISALASRQSAPIGSREELEAAYEQIAARYPDTGEPGAVPVPDDWAGWRLVPDSIEFWAGRSNRLHDRIRYTRTGPGTLDDAVAWTRERLQP